MKGLKREIEVQSGKERRKSNLFKIIEKKSHEQDVLTKKEERK